MSQFISQFLHLHRSRVVTCTMRIAEERGSAIVELALILGLFGAPLLLGTVQVSTLLYSSIEVSSAAHSGAMYGMMSSTFAADNAGMTTAAQQEASDFGASLAVTPTTYYACSANLDGAQYATQTAASSACSGTGNHPLQFVQVNVSVPVTPPVRFPGLPATITLSAKSAMEVEE
jgi:Flp pilus assembly protein TadG